MSATSAGAAPPGRVVPHAYPGPARPGEGGRRWPPSAVGAAAVALLVLVCHGISVWLVLGTPGDGVVMQSPVGLPWSTGARVVVVLELNPTNLQPGDEVLAVDGRDIHTWAHDLVHRPTAVRPWRPGELVVYQVRRDGAVREIGVPVQPGPSVRTMPQGTTPWGDVAARVLALLLTGFVFLRRPRVPAARALLVFAAAYMLEFDIPGFTLQVHPPFGPIGAVPYLLEMIGSLLWSAALLHFALVFPEPGPVAPRARLATPVYGLLYGLPLGMFGAYLGLIAGGAPTTGIRLVLFQGFVHLFYYVYPLAIVLAFVWKYRTTRDPRAREQLRWVAATVATVLVLDVGLWVLPAQLRGAPLLPDSLLPLGTVAGLVAVALVILRYRAFDLELLVNRTLVWGSLTVCVAAVYGGTLVLLGLVLERQTQPRLMLTLLATGLVALGLQPLRQRLQRAVNQWMYGDRDDPAAVLARVGRQLQATGPPDQVLGGIVATVGQAMKLPYVAVELDRAGQREVAASWGQPSGRLVALPLVHDSQTVGRLLVASGTQSGVLRPRDRRLLEVLAQQASAAVHAARLAVELADSRAQLERAHGRLLQAREEERRRLRRDLHDGIGPLLAGMTLQLDAARNLLGREPAGTDALLGTVRHELQLAIGDIRRLVDALQPTSLDQLGLVPALREAAARFSTGAAGSTSAGQGLLVLVEAPDDLPRLPAAVELAAYRIATEALTNTARHAHARNASITLTVDGSLGIEVRDDGTAPTGAGPAWRPGVGLQSMAERAAEVGGTLQAGPTPTGGRVHARLPLELA
jgi:two-component system, NarL family, sensor kinase